MIFMKDINKVQQELLAAVETSAYQTKTIVFGEGAENPALMMIGEAPGGDEEKQGRPFVGKAGKNLSAFLEVVGLKREEIYISNVVKLRPTKESPKTGKAVNRPPSAEEIAFFLPYLLEEIQVISPKVVVTLGNVPLKAVTGERKAVIGDYHGKPTPLADGRTLFALYHPAAVIYNRALQATYDEDLRALKAFLQKEGLA
ncbi:MAG: uracil-DNA glycosylase [Anaerotignum sp.]|nr:uracil-DNA glycosylase [Anaerotignum sp.]